MSFTQSALMQFSSTVQLGHIAAMHRVSVQGMQRSQAVTMSTAVGEHRPQWCTMSFPKGQGRLGGSADDVVADGTSPPSRSMAVISASAGPAFVVICGRKFSF